jgi:hypothetical protein
LARSSTSTTACWCGSTRLAAVVISGLYRVSVAAG